MTKKQREQVVELLRCAADQGGLHHAGVYAHSRDQTAHLVWLAYGSLVLELGAHQRLRRFENDALFLEAALRVEQGEWP